MCQRYLLPPSSRFGSYFYLEVADVIRWRKWFVYIMDCKECHQLQ
jgi:hypothetical protein